MKKMSNCRICNSLGNGIARYGTYAVNIQFDSNFVNEICYDADDKKFYFRITWRGCPKYDAVCVDMNGVSNQIEILHCPICGKKLSVNSLTRNCRKEDG